MYPNLYYLLKDWFGVEWKSLMFLNTFGLMVAVSFFVAAWIMTLEMRRKEKSGLLLPREETIIVGEAPSITELISNFIFGFLFGYKLLGIFWNKPDDMEPQAFIFSLQGSWVGGLLVGGLMFYLKWKEKKSQQLVHPEKRQVRIWPHDRVGDIVILALVAGVIGAKMFDNFENWDDFLAHPMERILSPGGLTFYGGLIVATITIIWFAIRKGIRVIHLADCIAPAMMIAYAVGRIGCQVSGDGDWGIYNSAYITNEKGKAVAAGAAGYQEQINRYSDYFLHGTVYDSVAKKRVIVTDRTASSLDAIPHAGFTAPSWLPVWMVAYAYPQNVNKDGVPISGITDEHNKALPVPVFPTPLYETVACLFLFLFLWAIRKRIKTAGVLSGIYLLLNGAERFAIEKIRVNNHSEFLGVRLSQAEIISLSLMIAGILLIFWARKYQSAEAAS